MPPPNGGSQCALLAKLGVDLPVGVLDMDTARIAAIATTVVVARIELGAMNEMVAVGMIRQSSGRTCVPQRAAPPGQAGEGRGVEVLLPGPC